MVKNVKKRSLSETDAADKPAAEAGKIKKLAKNGQVATEATKKLNKQNKKGKTGQIQKKVVVAKNETESEEKLEKIKQKQAYRAKRKLERLEKGAQFLPKNVMTAEQINDRIAEITSRETLTKTARRKLALLKKKLRTLDETSKPTKESVKKQGEKNEETQKGRKNKKKDAKPGSLLLINKSNDEEDEESEEDDENVDEASDVEEESNLDDDDNSEDEDEDEGNTTLDENKQKELKSQTGNKAANVEGKKKRFVLFVGNISFSSTVEDVKKHFLTKVSAVTDVRIPTDKDSKKSRGFAYVELSNQTDYEKALSLHNTFINGRKINVQYSASGNKNAQKKKEVVVKNKKLHALRKAGKLAGSQNNKKQKNSGKRGNAKTTAT